MNEITDDKKGISSITSNDSTSSDVVSTTTTPTVNTTSVAVSPVDNTPIVTYIPVTPVVTTQISNYTTDPFVQEFVKIFDYNSVRGDIDYLEKDINTFIADKKLICICMNTINDGNAGDRKSFKVVFIRYQHTQTSYEAYLLEQKTGFVRTPVVETIQFGKKIENASFGNNTGTIKV